MIRLTFYMEIMMKNPDAWFIEEYNEKGDVVWSAIMRTIPKEVSWFKDLPSKKHTIMIAPMFIDHDKAEKHTGVKTYKESTLRLVEANQGL